MIKIPVIFPVSFAKSLKLLLQEKVDYCLGPSVAMLI